MVIIRDRDRDGIPGSLAGAGSQFAIRASYSWCAQFICVDVASAYRTTEEREINAFAYEVGEG
jgi:hypothetical protein